MPGFIGLRGRVVPRFLRVSPEILRASIDGVLVRVLGIALTFAAGVVLARALGPAEYGLYGVALSTSAVVASLGTFGIPGLVSREASRACASGDAPMLTQLLVWSLRTATSFFGALLLLFVGAVLASGEVFPTEMQGLIAGLAVLTGFASLAAAFLRATGSLVLGQALDLVVRPGLFLGMVGFAILLVPGLDATTAMGIQVFVLFGILLYAGSHIARRVPLRSSPNARPTPSESWWRRVIPMGGTELLRTLDASVPSVLCAAFASLEDVGQFRVAAGVAGFILIPYSMFNTMAVPVVARLHAQERLDEVQSFAKFASLASGGSALALAAGLLAFGDVVTVAAFGPDYAAAWPVLVILSLAQVVHSAFGANPALLNALGREATLFWIFLVAFLLTVSLAVPLTFRMGAGGAALAILIAAVARAVALSIYTSRAFGIRCFALSRPSDGSCKRS